MLRNGTHVQYCIIEANILSLILFPYFGVDVSDEIFDYNKQPDNYFTTGGITFGTKRVKDITIITAAFWVDSIIL
jgi:hypothetical protein